MSPGWCSRRVLEESVISYGDHSRKEYYRKRRPRRNPQNASVTKVECFGKVAGKGWPIEQGSRRDEEYKSRHLPLSATRGSLTEHATSGIATSGHRVSGGGKTSGRGAKPRESEIAGSAYRDFGVQVPEGQVPRVARSEGKSQR